MTLNINMEKDELLENYFTERNLSQSAQVIYRRCVRYFENITGTSIIDCLNIADTEEENNIRWKNTHLRKWLINYRKWCYENYKKSTAHLYYVTIIGLFRHYEITVETLPRFSTKQTQPSIPINPDLMVDRDILKLCIETNRPPRRTARNDPKLYKTTPRHCLPRIALRGALSRSCISAPDS